MYQFFNVMKIISSLKIFAICLLLSACQTSEPQVEQNEDADSEFQRQVEQGLVLSNSTLEQSNSKGEILWRLKTTEAVYSPDKKTAKLKTLTANLFSDDVLILQISADEGELRKDGQEIYLNKNIIAVDPRNKAELRGDEVIWLPEQNIMTITGEKGIKANHEKLSVVAKQAKYNTESQFLELEKDIIGTTNKPALQLKTQRLFWQIEQGKVIGNEKLNLVRLEDKVVSDRLNTNKVQIDLNKNIAIVTGNVEYQSFEPLLQAATNKVTWYYADRRMESKDPIRLVQPEDKTTVTANEGKFDLISKQVDLKGGIYGESAENEAKIYADTLNWNLNNQQMEALGNVVYQQVEPDLNVQGKKATGNLNSKDIVVEGNTGDPVTTVIYTD